VKRLLVVVGGAFGAVALYRALTRQRVTVAPPVAAPPASDPRAEELRARLAESRALVDERDEFERGETTVDAAEPAATADDRRRLVHERGRAVADEMRGGEPA
jgi:hypothetical protein